MYVHRRIQIRCSSAHRSMSQTINWKNPLNLHIDFASEERTILERIALIGMFATFTAFCAQLYFLAPWSPVPYTFQTFAVMMTGVYLRRNDAFASGLLYLAMGALGAPVFAQSGDALFVDGRLIASGGYLLAFPIASAMVAEGLDRSRKAGVADIKAQAICWGLAMIPVYLIGTLWLAHAYQVDFAQAFEWGVEPFWAWDAFKIVLLGLFTAKVMKYNSIDE